MKLLVSSLVVSSFGFAGCVVPEESPALDDTEQAVTTPFVTASTCGLTGLGGIFSTPSTSEGVRTYRSGTTWGWEANAWKGIWGQCVQ